MPQHNRMAGCIAGQMADRMLCRMRHTVRGSSLARRLRFCEVQRFRDGRAYCNSGTCSGSHRHCFPPSYHEVSTNSLHGIGERFANLCSPRLPNLARAASAAPACADNPASGSAIALKLLISSNKSGAFGCVCWSAHRFLVSTEQLSIRQTECMSAPNRSKTADPDRIELFAQHAELFQHA